MKLVLISLFAASAFAQTLRFDVASVKLNELNDRIVEINPGPGGRFSTRAYSLKLLIQYAYNVKGYQIIGGPSWLDEDRWDVVARGKSEATTAELRRMLQSMLADRFALKVQRTQREMPGLELSVAGSEPKMKLSTATEETMSRDATGARLVTAISMPSWATAVGSFIGRPVVDKTGMPGLYDFKVFWNVNNDNILNADANGVSIQSALRDQLGLKLTSGRVITGVIIVESASKASSN